MNNNSVIPFQDAEIKYPNFAGRKSQFNRQGDRNFCIVIKDPEEAAELSAMGFNVKEKMPMVNEGDSYWLLQVSLSYHEPGSGLEFLDPKAYLVVDGKLKPLTEETIGCIDRLDAECIDITVTAGKPYEGRDGNMRVRAWLDSIYVTIANNPVAAKYATADIID